MFENSQAKWPEGSLQIVKKRLLLSIQGRSSVLTVHTFLKSSGFLMEECVFFLKDIEHCWVVINALCF